jgi:hypothetical protein
VKHKRTALPTPTPIVGGVTILGEAPEEAHNVTLVQRAFPAPGTGDWSDFYGDVVGRVETIEVNNFNEIFQGRNTAGHFQAWGVSPMNLVIQELSGCAALFCVSHVGKYTLYLALN